MPWVKIDDGFYDNTKNRNLGAPGRDLFIAGLCYCAKGLTDGVIPKADLPLILAQSQAKKALVSRLIAAGRWAEHEDHFEVVGYLDYQLSRDRVEADREAARARQRKARAKGSFGHGGSHGVTDGVTNAVSHSLPDPTRPPLLTSSSGSTVSTPRPEGIDPKQVDAVRQTRAQVFALHPKDPA